MSDKDVEEIALLVCMLVAVAGLERLWSHRIKPLVLKVIHPSAADQAPFLTLGPVRMSRVDLIGLGILLALTYLMLRILLRRFRAHRAAAAVDETV